MESPAVWFFIVVFFVGKNSFQLVPLIVLLLWLSHYIYRTFIFPFKIKSGNKTMPMAIAMMAFVFNLLNAYILARWVTEFGYYPLATLLQAHFYVGLLLFIGGYAINHLADNILIQLRKPGEAGYKVPQGFLYRYVSCPNYLGEIMEWFGFAILLWSWAGLAFAVFTAANLLPRALSNHRWCKYQFVDYPHCRKALIPYLL